MPMTTFEAPCSTSVSIIAFIPATRHIEPATTRKHLRAQHTGYQRLPAFQAEPLRRRKLRGQKRFKAFAAVRDGSEYALVITKSGGKPETQSLKDGQALLLGEMGPRGLLLFGIISCERLIS